MRVVGLDIHRVFAEAVMLDGGELVRLGRIGMTRDHLGAFARSLTHDDHVVVEATGNAAAVAEVLAPQHGSAPSRPRALQALEAAGILYDGQPHWVPTMLRDQTPSTTWALPSWL